MGADERMTMSEAYLIGGIRTPVGRHGGALADVRPDDLAALVVRAAVDRAGIAVDEVVLGAANQAGEDNRNVARMAVLLAGLPDEIPLPNPDEVNVPPQHAATPPRPEPDPVPPAPPGPRPDPGPDPAPIPTR